MSGFQRTLGIGELAQLVGVSTHALRVWERRYGSPEPLRRPSGHRRYAFEEVERLKLVAEALRLGFRAGVVVPATKDELHILIKEAREERERRAASQAQYAMSSPAKKVVEAVEKREMYIEEIPTLWPGMSAS